jgi:hypothetical protein
MGIGYSSVEPVEASKDSMTAIIQPAGNCTLRLFALPEPAKRIARDEAAAYGKGIKQEWDFGDMHQIKLRNWVFAKRIGSGLGSHAAAASAYMRVMIRDAVIRQGGGYCHSLECTRMEGRPMLSYVHPSSVYGGRLPPGLERMRDAQVASLTFVR